MKFESLILAAELDPNDYPALANILVEVFDQKNREITGELEFAEPLFSKNLDSKRKFETFLEEEQSKCLTDSIDKIRVVLTNGFFCLFYPSVSNLKLMLKLFN